VAASPVNPARLPRDSTHRAPPRPEVERPGPGLVGSVRKAQNAERDDRQTKRG